MHTSTSAPRSQRVQQTIPGDLTTARVEDRIEAVQAASSGRCDERVAGDPYRDRAQRLGQLEAVRVGIGDQHWDVRTEDEPAHRHQTKTDRPGPGDADRLYVHLRLQGPADGMGGRAHDVEEQRRLGRRNVRGGKEVGLVDQLERPISAVGREPHVGPLVEALVGVTETA